MLLVFGKLLRGWILGLEKKEVITVATEMYQAIEERRSIRYRISETYLLCLLAEVYARCDQTEEGLNMITEAQSWMDKVSERCWESEIYRLKGELLLSQTLDNQHEAESCFQKALDVSRRQRAKSLELRASVSLSRLWQSQGKNEEARSLLSEIYGWFTEGFDTPDLKEAKALLDELS